MNPKEYKAQYYQENKKKILERSKKYYQKNKKAILERNANYYQNNRNRVLLQNKLRRFKIDKKSFLKYEKEHPVCEICGLPAIDIHPRSKKKCGLRLDHNHINGKIRGLLCRDCNTALGLLKVDEWGTVNLQMSINYIEGCNNGQTDFRTKKESS